MNKKYVVAIHLQPDPFHNPQVEVVTYTKNRDGASWDATHASGFTSFLPDEEMHALTLPHYHQFVFDSEPEAILFANGVKEGLNAIASIASRMVNP